MKTYDKSMNENDLKQVSGGFSGYEITEMRYDLSKGDTFKSNSGNMYYVVVTGVTKVPVTELITVRSYSGAPGQYREIMLTHVLVSALLSDYTYLGNGVITDDEIIKERHIIQ